MTAILRLMTALLLCHASLVMAQNPDAPRKTFDIVKASVHDPLILDQRTLSLPSDAHLAWSTQFVHNGVHYAVFDQSPELTSSPYPMENLTISSGRTSGKGVVIIVGTMAAIIGFLYLRHQDKSQ